MTSKTKILVIVAHPQLNKSKVNKTLLDSISNLNFVKINNLYDEYPDFYIDVRYEQKLLIEHDCIVFQHPFYWYSSPSLLKEWQDAVLEKGFAYGDGGNKLEGKTWQSVVSAGGAQEAYSPSGYNNFPMNDFLKPFQQTAYLCKMTYKNPFVIHGAHHLSQQQLQNYGTEYVSLLEGLNNGIK